MVACFCLLSSSFNACSSAFVLLCSSNMNLASFLCCSSASWLLGGCDPSALGSFDSSISCYKNRDESC
ncbi:hypothetical protein O6H91_11G091100 [Diphasiastrum complanatum]|uniref:Uncharacterized protein n=1 Tax=Diphasiastrum complanatum TaxID=34168 RepID=A0ACC2CBU0_DIPCM|nr:hypothetical protein O6H91_11G091100 [Diphasiastrum complanatum]